MGKALLFIIVLLFGSIYYHYTIVQKHMSDYNNSVKINFITNKVEVADYSKVTFSLDYKTTQNNFKKSLIKSLNEGCIKTFDIYAMLIKYRG